jgi:Na+/proline symporter
MDFVKALTRKQRSEEYFLNFSKVSTIAWAAILVLVAYLSKKVDFVLNAALALRGLTSGALLGGLLLVVMWKKGPAMPVLVGMVTSLIVMTAVQVLPQLPWSHFPDIYWPWYALIGTSVMIGTSWLVRSLSTTASDETKLPP